MRVVTTDFVVFQRDGGLDMRSILGGRLFQDRDIVAEGERLRPAGEMKVVTKRDPTEEEWIALRFAWRVCAHVPNRTRSRLCRRIGPRGRRGPDELAWTRAKVAVMKVASAQPPVSLHGSVAGVGCNFAFCDGLDAIADAGATAVVQPGGSGEGCGSDRRRRRARAGDGLYGRRHFHTNFSRVVFAPRTPPTASLAASPARSSAAWLTGCRSFARAPKGFS